MKLINYASHLEKMHQPASKQLTFTQRWRQPAGPLVAFSQRQRNYGGRGGCGWTVKCLAWAVYRGAPKYGCGCTNYSYLEALFPYALLLKPNLTT